MIYDIDRHTVGEEPVPASDLNLPAVVDEYKDVIVKKPWGYEYLVFENEFVAVWMLHLVRKRRTSMHCHPRKTTSLIMLSGNAEFHHEAGSLSLSPMDAVFISEGMYHSTESFNSLPVIPQSENGNWVLEIECPPEKGDLVRKNDAYGRVGKSYEGCQHMIYNSETCLTFTEEDLELGADKSFFDNKFRIIKTFEGIPLPSDDSLLCAVSYDLKRAKCDGVVVGRIEQFKNFWKKVSNKDLSAYTFLLIERERRMMRVADYIFKCIADLGVKDVFAVSGGGAMHLVDAVGKNERLNYVATHHEQAASMAAEGNARLTGVPGTVLVTSGPGGTNAITGVCGAWIDSIPMICVSGQVTTDALIKDTGLRQLGIQESDISTLVASITKYAVTVVDPLQIKYHVQKAIHLASTGRPGPVWLDIPLDVQSKLVNPDELQPFESQSNLDENNVDLSDSVSKAISLIKQSKRPVVICGYGVRLSGAGEKFLTLIEKLKIPVISSWTSSDLVPTDHDLYIGRSGIMGDRAGNFTVQNSDLLLIIGSRMSVPHVGYKKEFFAREAKKIVVDIDSTEFKKQSMKPELGIESDAGEFIDEVLTQIAINPIDLDISSWLNLCLSWKKKYPVVLPEYKENKNLVNSFYFVDKLSEKLDSEAVVVTDMGTSFTCTMQTFRTKKGQRLFTSSGDASMGFGLPGAIGACYGKGKKKTICISGDGGLQMNIQELQTVVHNKLPIILFVLNNKGYLTIKLMQQNHFGRYVGSDPSSGVSCPDTIKIAEAYGIPSIRISDQKTLDEKIDWVLEQEGPFICEIMMPENQPLIPRVSSLKKPDGTIVSKPLEDLYPFLDREEFAENMIVKPIEPLT